MKTLIKIIFVVSLSFLFVSICASQDNYEKSHKDMVVNQIKKRGVKDPATLKALQKVKRHLFVPEKYQRQAYEDGPLPIGFGQTISQPYMVAYMTEVIRPKPHFKVLEVGTGSGYQAAVLAEIVDEVYTIEIIKELGDAANKRLKELGYQNIFVKIDDGYHGWEEKGPFDAIIVTAAAEFIPPPLIEQLKEGGKMVIPIGTPFQVQRLMLVEKKNGKVKTKSLFPVMFVPFTRS